MHHWHLKCIPNGEYCLFLKWQLLVRSGKIYTFECDTYEVHLSTKMPDLKGNMEIVQLCGAQGKSS